MPASPGNVGECSFAGKDNLGKKFPFASKDVRDLKAKRRGQSPIERNPNP